MFSAARWRLTSVFTGVLAVILIVSGIVVYLTTRSVIYDRVDSDLEERARDQLFLFTGAEHGPPREPAPKPESEFDPGGYFYALSDAEGQVYSSSPFLDAQTLASISTLEEAIDKGDAFTNTESSRGDPQRIYVFAVTIAGGGEGLAQIGRSTEPEEEALSQLRTILLAVLAVSIVPAVVGGYLLSGRALRPIKTAMDSQRVFIADASHELRTPVAVVRTNAELLKRHMRPLAEDPDRDTVALEDILSESDRLGRMVDQMLTLAEADAGEREASLSDILLSEVAEEAVRSITALAHVRGVIVDARLDENVEVRGDRARLRELLVVLLDNAVKYTGAGGRVELAVRQAHRKATITVSDTGHGIPPESLPRIFDRFYRIDKARSRESGGTGLGLAIARHIVQAHGGTINIGSAVGQGTTVTVELPL